MDRRW